MDDDSKEYLKMYIKLTDKLIRKIENHINRYNTSNSICAYYSDWKDFCSDWCDGIGYTRTEARQLLHNGTGEFMILPNDLGIIRFNI